MGLTIHPKSLSGREEEEEGEERQGERGTVGQAFSQRAPSSRNVAIDEANAGEMSGK